MKYVIVAIVAAVGAAVIAWIITRLSLKGRIREAELKLDTEKQLREHELQLREQEAEHYEKTLKDIREDHEKALEATKNQLAIENEKTLKAREESLKKEAEETIKSLTAGLNQQIKSMTEAFEAQKKSHSEETSSIKTQFAETVRNLQAQTDAIGHQAVDLARALKGKNKMQGIFGETVLENILKQENLQNGRDYDTEWWLRDRSGRTIENEASGRRMRPDVALHFPDGTDILIDAKVSLTALAEYFAAETDEARHEAAVRNLASVEEHVRELAGKEYQKYVEGRETLEYVIMFIPNYGAYQLAKQERSDIFSFAFKQNVLITTEETLIPFLRLIRSAWVHKAQMENMAEIVAAARRMIDRVAIFAEKNAELENQLKRTVKLFEENTARLTDSRQSIVKAANDVIESGVSLSPGKILPETKEKEPE